MNLRGNKNTSNIQPKKNRKSREKKVVNPENVSPKLQTLVEQFTNITSSLSFRNEINNQKEVCKNNSMTQDETTDLNLHITSNSFEMMHTSNCEESVLPLSSQEPAPLINSTQIAKSNKQFPSLRETAFIGKIDARGRKTYTWIKQFESLIDLDTYLRTENASNIITTHNTNVNCTQCVSHNVKHKMVQMYRKCKCNKPDCTLTYKINKCEFNKIWNLSVYGAHLVKDTVKDTSVNVRSPGKKSHKRYGVALVVQSIYESWLNKDNNLTAQQLLSRIIDKRKEETEKKKKKKKDVKMKYIFNKQLIPSLRQVIFI